MILKNFPEYKQQEKVLLRLAAAYKKSGQKEKSEETLRKIVEKYPNGPLTATAKKELSSLQAGKK